MYSRSFTSSLKSFICGAIVAIATLCVGVGGVSAQPPAPSPLDRNVIATVDRVYPGFAEILETCNAVLLPRLARTLAANPSRDSLQVLAAMLTDCPAWSDGNGEAAAQLMNLSRAVGAAPADRLSRVLLSGNADQRLAAAIAVNGTFDLMTPGERQELEKALIASLSDAHLSVREWVALPLRRLDTPAGNVALTRALDGPDMTDMFYFQASGRARPRPARRVDASAFRPQTVAAVNRIAPNFLNTLSSANEGAIIELRQTLERSIEPAATDVLVWILVNERDQWYLPQVLATRQRVTQLPFAQLGSLLATAEDPRTRQHIAELLTRSVPQPNLPASSLDELIRALIPHRGDRRLDVRVNVLAILASALKRRGTPVSGTHDVARELGELVGERDLSGSDLGRVAESLGAVGDRSTLPLLERMARSTTMRMFVRESAARAHIAIAGPSDRARELRRLVWEQPETTFEKRVQSEGQAALPLAWQALVTGSASERRAAAALLAWRRDAGSIRPILAALDKSPGAVTGEQLLFALNMILLTEGTPAAADERNALAAAHLRWLYGQLATQPIDDYIRTAVFAGNRVAVFPDHVVAPFSIELSATTTGTRPGETGKQVSATAVRSETPQAFLQSVAKNQWGVAFHAVTVGDDVARVATTLYLPAGRIANQVWISLYRKVGGTWVPIAVPPHPVLHRLVNEPNLLPVIDRDYGAAYPLKVLRLDLTMERIRVDLRARDGLSHENVDWWGTSTSIDASYVPLFDRYRRSDSSAVRYVAEFELANLTGRPDVELWLDTLAKESGTPFQQMALQVIGTYATNLIKSEGRQIQGNERNELVAAALKPAVVDSRLLPSQLPRPENILRVEASARFALVHTMFGSGPRAASGYSMLFERRGDRWVFLFCTTGWIS